MQKVYLHIYWAHAAGRITRMCLVDTFYRQTDLCYIMDVQEWHITNRKFQNSGALVFVPKEPMDLANLDKGVPPITCFEWRGWLRAGFPFSR
ncbi:hypothetical protein J6590_100756 [Homalodisca vitripennis]|nr:hypothetical protein J6590_100756 [Homalodisca vitripennis]